MVKGVFAVWLPINPEDGFVIEKSFNAAGKIVNEADVPVAMGEIEVAVMEVLPDSEKEIVVVNTPAEKEDVSPAPVSKVVGDDRLTVPVKIFTPAEQIFCSASNAVISIGKTIPAT